MADATRQETVEQNIEDAVAKYGESAWNQIQTQILTDISVSLAMLVDGASSEE